ncbi:Troponin family protein [Candida parapsilosis]|uniref:GRIP domain-containing protein n=2 Tax=Candida parapsilosis TaxID=5480 RepID=G8BDG2_CANPC|nr:uncharacterized protein CPAR2_209540 [Candida parapsilosis]KAF6054540.1 Troponin family protein [Candida parapsilosis]KAF6056434.1 Troponin family protein [Candida parapsilosis]KAF6059368.1 Troponin family protein [Candida parapsilosis]KAF6068124.1 Troponin family protein [Candida parapsilosis]KAI5905241.1 GRIP domain-containing protein RUD3 [Candida parapsilosis]
MGKNKKKSKKQDDTEEITTQLQNDISEPNHEIEKSLEQSEKVPEVIETNGVSSMASQSETNIENLTLEKLQQVEKERDEIKHSYDNLVSRLSSFKTVFANMKKAEVELEEKSELVDKLNEDNDKLKEENSRLKKSLENEASNKVEQTLYSQLQEQNTNLNNECEKLSDTLTKTRREYTSTIEELQDEKYSLENENSKMSKKVHELKQQINDLTVAQGEFDQEKRDLADSVNVFKERLDVKDKELKSANANIEELNNLISENSKLFEKEKSSLLERIEGLNKIIAEKDDTIETLRTEVRNMKQKLLESELKSSEIADLKKELNNKQLLIGKLRHEAVILNEHLTKALTMMKQKGEGSNKTVDAELLSNVIISFLQFPRGDSKKFEALQLISALLEWDQSQKIAAGLQHVPNAKGGRTKVDPDGNETPTRQSFISLWTEFLEKESSGK